jgi:hypothetical protein
MTLSIIKQQLIGGWPMTSLKRMLKIAEEIEASTNPFEFDSDRILSRYPELSVHQAILIDSYIIQRVMGVKELKMAIVEAKQYK